LLATFLPAFLITFREALEAALIVVIIASYLKKIQKEERTKIALACKDSTKKPYERKMGKD